MSKIDDAPAALYARWLGETLARAMKTGTARYMTSNSSEIPPAGFGIEPEELELSDELLSVDFHGRALVNLSGLADESHNGFEAAVNKLGRLLLPGSSLAFRYHVRLAGGAGEASGWRYPLLERTLDHAGFRIFVNEIPAFPDEDSGDATLPGDTFPAQRYCLAVRYQRS